MKNPTEYPPSELEHDLRMNFAHFAMKSRKWAANKRITLIGSFKAGQGT